MAVSALPAVVFPVAMMPAPIGPQSVTPLFDSYVRHARFWVDFTGDIIEETAALSLAVFLRPWLGDQAIPVAEDLADQIEDAYEAMWGPLGED
ncbi:MAG: hypothetical protein ACPGOY_16015 [Rhodospirillaceae bacterium]